MPNASRRLLPMPPVAPSDHRVTTFELFFDLVYVFAFTQVTALMAHAHSAVGVLQGILVLGLLWWTWAAFSWLANQSPADRGYLRVGLATAMVIVFVGALAIPEAYDDGAGGLFGPLVFAGAYAGVRLVHIGLYASVVGDDRTLRRQVALTFFVALVPGVTAIVIGAALGGDAQLWLWIAAFAYDFAATWLTSKLSRGWRIQSVTHWVERYGLVVIIALGESVVATGVGVAQLPITAGIVVGGALSIGLSIGLWRAYFLLVQPLGESGLERLEGHRRVEAAEDAHTYLHLPLIVGVIVVALGIEVSMAHVDDAASLGWFGAAALGGGQALYLAATGFIAVRVGAEWPVVRLAFATIVAASVPVLALVPPLAALGLAAALQLLIALTERAAPRPRLRRLRVS